MSNSVVDTLKQTFSSASQLTADDLATIYTQDVTFVDPLGKIEGLDRLASYFAGVYKNVTHCRFEYLDELRNDHQASVKWDMVFNHPRLSGGDEITVRGVTLLEFKDKVHYHEDVYDVGALMYENIPLLGVPVRWLKRRAHNVSAS